MKSSQTFAFLVAIVVLAVSPRLPASEYHFNYGPSYSAGNAVNDSGTIAGLISFPSPYPLGGFIYSNGQTTYIANGTWSLQDMNGFGQAVGYMVSGNFGHPYLFSNGQLTDLGLPVGAYEGEALGINELGQIVGWASFDNFRKAVSYENGNWSMVAHPLGFNTFGYDVQAVAINTDGVIAGNYDSWIDGNPQTGGGYSPRAFINENGVPLDLGTLGGRYSVASDINDAKQVVGRSGNLDGNDHAFLFSNNTMLDLGTLTGASDSVAYGINDYGHVVGSSGGKAFIYRNGAMVDLNTISDVPSWITLMTANDISNNGTITGTARVRAGTDMSPMDFDMAYILSVPEPSTCCLGIVGTGLACVVMSKKRWLSRQKARRLNLIR